MSLQAAARGQQRRQRLSAAHMMPATAIDLRHCKAQGQAYHRLKPGNRVSLPWGRGVGKTWFIRIMMWLLVAEWDRKVRRNEALKVDYHGIRIALIYPTLAQFKRIGQAQHIVNELSPTGAWGGLGASINRSTWTIDFPGGSNIQIVTAETMDSFRGMRRDLVAVDEADDVDIGSFEAVTRPWFSEPVSLNMTLIAGTPRRGRFGLLWKSFHTWVHGDAKYEPVPRAYGFHATAYDCSPAIVNRSQLEQDRNTVNRERFEREWMCNFDSGEGLVYPFFDHGLHVRRPPMMDLYNEFIVGFDYGFSEPSAFLVIGVAGKGKDAICHVLREEYVYQKSDTELTAIAQDIDRNFSLNGRKPEWYCDHHPSTLDAFRAAHVKVNAAEKGPGSVESGVSFVADALFVREDEDEIPWSQLYVDPGCAHTIDEFGKYRRKRGHVDNEGERTVLDNIDTSRDDHCMDALRYALVGRFAGPDDRLGVNDLRS